MPMQLHHLHTDGPKPLYKKITADEYERMTARIAELERMDTEHTLQIAKMNGYIHHLEEERRWRKCSAELPEVGVEVLVTNGIDCGISDWCGDYWNNDPFCGSPVCDNVIAWMPLPSAPKEEK